MEDQKQCPLCHEVLPENAKAIYFTQLLVNPIAILKDQITRLDKAANDAREQGNTAAEYAALEQIRLLCDTLAKLFQSMANF